MNALFFGSVVVVDVDVLLVLGLFLVARHFDRLDRLVQEVRVQVLLHDESLGCLERGHARLRLRPVALLRRLVKQQVLRARELNGAQAFAFQARRFESVRVVKLVE